VLAEDASSTRVRWDGAGARLRVDTHFPHSIRDPDGRVAKIFPKVRVKEHVDEVVEAVREVAKAAKANQ